jgi:hypothetical protein
VKGTKFTSEEYRGLMAAIGRLEPDPAISGNEVLHTVARLLAAGWEIIWPDHEATSSSPITDPSIFQENNS